LVGRKWRKTSQKIKILSRRIAVVVQRVKTKEQKFEATKRRKSRDVVVEPIEAVSSVGFGCNKLQKRFI